MKTGWRNQTSQNEKGQGLVEYGIILAAVAVGLFMVLILLGNGLKSTFCNVAKGLGSNVEAVCTATYCNDSFDNLSNWSASAGWGLFNGQLCNTTTGEHRIANTCSTKPTIPSDYTVNIKVATLFSGYGYGLIFRQQSITPFTGYTFQYDPGYGSGAFIFRKFVNGTELAPFAVAPAPTYSWYNQPRNIRVEAHGNIFKAYVDDVLVLTATDNTWTRGGIGLRTWDSSSACFDNISITAP